MCIYTYMYVCMYVCIHTYLRCILQEDLRWVPWKVSLKRQFPQQVNQFWAVQILKRRLFGFSFCENLHPVEILVHHPDFLRYQLKWALQREVIFLYILRKIPQSQGFHFQWIVLLLIFQMPDKTKHVVAYEFVCVCVCVGRVIRYVCLS